MELKSKENKGPGSFETLLFFLGLFNIISGIIWTITGFGDEEPNIWAWFSRYALGVICLGFVGVIREIRKLREKQN